MKENHKQAWLSALRPLLRHTLPHLPRLQGKRLFVAAWWLGSFILTTAYMANLIAFLTIPAYPGRLQTVEQLADSPYRLVNDLLSPASPCLAVTLHAYVVSSLMMFTYSSLMRAKNFILWFCP